MRAFRGPLTGDWPRWIIRASNSPFVRICDFLRGGRFAELPEAVGRRG